MEPVNEPIDLKKAVLEAQIMLEHISARGKIADANRETINAILIKPDEIQNLDKQAEVNFWLAYSKLSQMAKPATLESITLNREVTKGKAPFAISVVKRYRTSGLITIIALLILQMYWIVGVGLLADVRSIPGKIEDLIIEKEARTKELGDQAGDDLKILFMETKIDNLNSDLETSSKALNEWNIAYRLYEKFSSLSFSSADSTAELATSVAAGFSIDENSEESKINYSLKYSPYVLDVIQSYFLPLLYGLLGGFAFILRNLSKEIHESAFTMQSRAGYLLRIFLGALAGLAIGWFFNTGTQGGFSLGSLSPLALAFLAGYSVEVLFALMDKIIELITKANNSNNNPNPAPVANNN